MLQPNNKTTEISSTINRQEPCRLCNHLQANLVSVVDYWDIYSGQLVRCLRCGHAQLDPMLSPEQMSLGCRAYYIDEELRVSSHEHFRNRLRNFRRGVVFAYSLKWRGVSPKSILEYGPGSGYFLEGLRFVFPDSKVTVMDVVPEVLEFNLKEHGFSGIEAAPDSVQVENLPKFDLIIARDLIEHVAGVSQLVKNTHDLLIPGGLWHFITPNGYEDIWGLKMNWQIRQKPAELLINHVNYFDGNSLHQVMEQNGFKPLEYYAYDLKGFFQGKRWRNILRWSTNSTKRPVQAELTRELKQASVESKAKILDQWYIQTSHKWLTWIICFYHHGMWFHLNPKWKIGHEISGLYRRV
ncbi:MAG: class I SAM-dependent methyltransferase [Bdellovibrionota bacterium]